MTKQQSASKQLREDKKRIYKQASNPAIKRRKREDRLRIEEETISKFLKRYGKLPFSKIPTKEYRKYTSSLKEVLKAQDEDTEKLKRRVDKLLGTARGNLN